MTVTGTAEGTADRARWEPGGPVAALDLGTNNCRLLVAKPSHEGFRVIDAFSRIVRLGEGVDATGRLSGAAIDRSIAALRVCAYKLRRRSVRASRAVATEACRRAENFLDFRDRVQTETGISLEVITTREEARLAANGCSPLLDPTVSNALLFDIGGGSTELIWASVAETGAIRMVDATSLPVGVVNLAERHGGHEVSEDTYQAMIARILQQLMPFEREHGIRSRIAAGSVQMLGSSGTVTTLAGVHKNLPRYDRSKVDGTYLDFSEAVAACRHLRAMDYQTRLRHPCIGRDRADLVVVGCAVLEAICRLWPVGRLRIADRGVREGILLDLLAGRRSRSQA